MPDSSLVQALAASFVAGEMTTSQVVARGASTLGRRWRWLSPLAQRYIEFFSGRTRPRRRDVIAFLLRDQGFLRASSKYSDELTIASRVTGPQRMQPAGPAAGWEVPPIESAGALAEWLAVDAREQQWFADLKGLASREWNSRLNHYKYQVVSKSDGGMRLIEAPKTRLRAIQRQILSGILENIPVHPAAHGFVKGRSIKSFVAPHVGQQIILRMDLKDFFPSFRAARVQSFSNPGLPRIRRQFAGRNLHQRRTSMRMEKLRAEHRSRSAARSEDFVFATAFAARRADVACAGEPPYVSSGLSAYGTGEIDGCKVFSLCRRSGIFRRCGIRAAH